MKKIIAGLVIALALTSCIEGDNDKIRNSADDTFRYTHWSQESLEGKDNAKLHFINMYTLEPMTWEGDVRDAMVYLEQIDKDKCYKNPVTRDMAVEVDCP